MSDGANSVRCAIDVPLGVDDCFTFFADELVSALADKGFRFEAHRGSKYSLARA
jgi:hypothetical protein